MTKILIADDSIAVRKVAERLLTEAGMAVSLAANGTEALAFLGRECPDLVVSDVIMPDKSGYEVCSFVRTQPSLAEIPVLLISGIVNDEVTKQAELCRADGVLKKPFQGTSLKDRVHDLLAKRRSHSEGTAVNGKHPAVTMERPVPTPKNAGPEDRPLSVADADVATATPRVSLPEATPAVAEAALSRADILGARIVELERALADERERASQATVQAETLAERFHEMEAKLAKERAEQQQREQGLQMAWEQERAERQQREQGLQTALEEERAERQQREQDLQSTWESERKERQQREQAMEASLDRERASNQELRLRIEQLHSTLTETQRRADEELEAKTAEAATLSDRIREAESAFAVERQAADARLTEAAAIAAARIGELEATLNAERDAAAQLVEQITGLERLEGRVQELDARLFAEREKSAGLQQIVSKLEEEAARAKELDAALIAERERCAQFEAALSSERQQAAILVQQVKELDEAVNRARELDVVLAGERERSTQLAKRATEAEHLANQSTRRLEDMARKLAEIAGLASQLANSQR
jgi:CheY-like chemotaxis protein